MSNTQVPKFPLTEILMGYVRLYWKLSIVHKLFIIYMSPLIVILFILIVLNEVIGNYVGIELPIQKMFVNKKTAQSFYDEVKI